MKHQIDVKAVGDQELLALIVDLQERLANQHALDSTTLDWSEENEIAIKILHAKYLFLYNEARRRHTKSSIFESVITQ